MIGSKTRYATQREVYKFLTAVFDYQMKSRKPRTAELARTAHEAKYLFG
jgi:hypothetical protein